MLILLGLGKSLIPAVNSAHIQVLGSSGSCTPGSWAGWILTGCGAPGKLVEDRFLDKGSDGEEVYEERDQKNKGEDGGVDTEKQPGDKEGRIY